MLREDAKNPKLLFAGTEFAIYVTLDGGKSWHRLMHNLPTVAVHDLVIHPRDGDLIAGTHGRGLWILDDITPLQQLSDEVLNAGAHLFEQRPATIWNDHTRGGVRGHFFFAGENPPYIPKRKNIVRAKLVSGGLINYYLKNDAGGMVQLEISDLLGENKRILYGPGEAGIHRVLWDLRFDPTPEQTRQFVSRFRKLIQRIERLPRLTPKQKALVQQARSTLDTFHYDSELNRMWDEMAEEFTAMNLFRRAFRGRLQGKPAPPGEYRITLTVNGTSYFGKIRVRRDPMKGW
ncbi:MAG: hypothetical protein Q9P14_18290 [candidate division KSB1 bacterium]|nr:hypothetical protein [candidate division KSB1 bacterium]